MQGPVIKRVEVYPFNYKAGDDSPVVENVMVRVAARVGEEVIEGWGEGPVGDPACTGQSREVAANDVMQRIAPAILGKSFFTSGDVMELVKNAAARRPGMGSAACAVDSALFRLLAIFQKIPVKSLVREFLWLPPEEEMPKPGEPLTVVTGEEILSGKATPGEIPFVIDGREAFTSPEQFIHACGELSGNVAAVLQPFHRETPYMVRELKKLMKTRDINSPVISDGLPASREAVEEMIKSRTFDGLAFVPGRDGGISNLLGICDLLKEHRRFILTLKPVAAIGIGISGAVEMLSGCREFFQPRPWFFTPPTDLDRLEGVAGTGGGIDLDFLEARALSGSVASIKNGEITLQSFPYLRGKPDFRKVARYHIDTGGTLHPLEN